MGGRGTGSGLGSVCVLYVDQGSGCTRLIPELRATFDVCKGGLGVIRW